MGTLVQIKKSTSKGQDVRMEQGFGYAETTATPEVMKLPHIKSFYAVGGRDAVGKIIVANQKFAFVDRTTSVWKVYVEEDEPTLARRQKDGKLVLERRWKIAGSYKTRDAAESVARSLSKGE